jgi:hypothetical protein
MHPLNLRKHTMLNPKITQALPFVNLLLLIMTNVLVAFTWVKIYTAEVDTMFIAIFLLLLAGATLYYLVLFSWSWWLVLRRKTVKHVLRHSLLLFVMTIVPMAVIYYFTS